MEEQIPQTTPIEPSQAPKKFNWLPIIGLFLILAVVLAAALFLKQKVSPKPDSQNSSSQSATTSSEPLVSGLIDWHYPSYSYMSIFKNTDTANQYAGQGKFSDVGIFKSGKYSGDHLIVATFPCAELCSPVTAHVVIVNGTSNYIVLKNYSDSLDNVDTSVIDTSKYTVDSETKIPDLEFPQNISGPKPGQNLTRTTLGGGYSLSYTLFNATNLKPIFFDPKVGQVYTTPDDPAQVGDIYARDGFYVKAPDWNVIIYAYKPNFVKDDGSVNITWNDGTKVIKQYVYTDRTGCGSSNYGSIVRGVSVENDLVKSGATDLGDPIYEFKDKNHPFLKNIYDTQYNPYNGPKLSYDEFMANHPVFFWVDSFGRLFRFANNDFQPQAECGKPVIYLYPTKAENVNVKLSLTGGFSYTEPAYGSGWNVLANPSGELTNLADSKIYPYLFWEGRSSDVYQIPDKGFVIAKENVHEFLDSKLALLGLNKKESADFEAYWEPYMQSASYYFVTFMGNAVLDRIAPLQVTPKPDTIIRVLMDFKPLEKPMDVQGYDIKTPERSGFTVVEWGGVKHSDARQ